MKSTALLWERHIEHIRACIENSVPESEPAEQDEFSSFAQRLTTDPVYQLRV